VSLLARVVEKGNSLGVKLERPGLEIWRMKARSRPRPVPGVPKGDVRCSPSSRRDAQPGSDNEIAIGDLAAPSPAPTSGVAPGTGDQHEHVRGVPELAVTPPIELHWREADDHQRRDGGTTLPLRPTRSYTT
jgi:hypothetical protein